MIFRGCYFRATKKLRELHPKAIFRFSLTSDQNIQMAQSAQHVDPSSFAMENAELPKEPRFLFIRASLELAQLQDRELRRLAKSPDAADTQQAVSILQSEAIAAPEKGLIQPCWGHPNASYWLLHTKSDPRAFIYSEEDLYIATVFCAAELQVSRDVKFPDLELFVFGLAPSANQLITGWWKGRQLGLVRFLAAAAKHNGAIFSPNGVSRRAWGLGPKAKLDDISRAIKDLAKFPSSLHLAAWEIGAWPMLITGTQTAMSLGRIIRYLFDFARALPDRCEFHHAAESSSSEEDEDQAKKRKIDQDQSSD